MPIANISHAEIYYELHGQGQPLILIAGYTCDHLFWSLVLVKLAAHFQVLLFDNRGVGKTKDNGKAFTLETLAEDVVLLAHQLDLKKPHVVGHSMGGAIAQLIGYKYSNQIDKLAILNSAAKFNTRTLRAIEGLLNLRKEKISIERQLEVNMPWFFSSEFLSDPNQVSAFKTIMTQCHNPMPQPTKHRGSRTAISGHL